VPIRKSRITSTRKKNPWLSFSTLIHVFEGWMNECGKYSEKYNRSTVKHYVVVRRFIPGGAGRDPEPGWTGASRSVHACSAGCVFRGTGRWTHTGELTGSERRHP
jgi:hypothetical protein